MEKTLRITKIEQIENEDRYDLSIENTHNFFANNILVHNCRLITIIDENSIIKFYSRQGKEFEVLENLKSEVKKLNLKNVVLDGEICIVDSEGNENFQDIMKQIRRKEHIIDNPKYLVFDIINYEDFFKQESKEIFSDRQKKLKEVMKNYNGNNIEILKQTKIESEEHFIELCNEAKEKKWEGLILRKDTFYKGKRSNDLLKVKETQDNEYEVIGYEFGPFRVIENGVEKTIETLSAIKIEHKGNIVSVGSGFSIDQRKEFYNDINKIMNKIVTIQFFEETLNKEGKYSLRFPIIKVIHGDKREV